MTDRPPTTPDRSMTGRDRPPTDRVRVPAAEAARILNLTSEAVRSRIRRGTLEAERDQDGWHVYLPAGPVADRSRPPVDRPVTDHRPDAILAGKDEVIRRQDDEIAYLRAELAKRSAELAAERERSDVLQQLALSRIPAVTAGEPFSVAQEAADELIEPDMADDPFARNDSSQRPTDARAREWSDLTEQLITELGMTPAAARLAAAQELGLAG